MNAHYVSLLKRLAERPLSARELERPQHLETDEAIIFGHVEKDGQLYSITDVGMATLVRMGETP